MIKKANYIILGSTGRNTGKTEFACRLIERYSKTHTVYGVKVTTIRRDEGGCPRGGSGCGVCSSLNADFEITEEKSSGSVKDTHRMLQAGAGKVFWLKVFKDALPQGVDALLKLLPEDAMMVCESNTLRTIIEPGLFFIIRNMADKSVKPSCADVIQHADKIIGFNKMAWDFTPDRVHIKDQTWIMREKATAIILAGGKSIRMGGDDKSLLPVDGQPLIAHIVDQLQGHFDEIIIGSNDPGKYKFLNLRIIQDIEKDKGPLMGILSCLKASSSEVNFITACDIPVMNTKLILDMIQVAKDAEIVMPVSGDNNYEPLYALYKKSIIPAAEIILKNQGRRIIELLNDAKVRFFDFEHSNWYENLNRKDDYLKFIKTRENKQCFREVS
ncbi:MAG: NTP transferase domain-containing protein [Bacteroidales bacterium]